MEQRLFRFFLLAIAPFVLLFGLVANFWITSSGQNSNPEATWIGSTPFSFGVQALVALLATFAVITLKQLSRVSVRPVNALLNEVQTITAQQAVLPPQSTGLAEIDITLQNLFLAATDAQRRLDAERTLAADVSHQLRSPLTALSLRLEQIVQDTSDTQVHDDAVAALNQVDRLVRLVEGLLTTWRSTSDRELSEIDISKFLATVQERWQSRLQSAGRNIEVFSEPKLIALGTPEIQDLVISVLIENSLQHGAGTIRITSRDYQSWILIEISDQGEGITPDIESSLMVQGTTTGGTGLGLAWARSQVASDGGRLELRNLKPAAFGIFLMSATK
jgi:signal transduction histidine kinase